MAYKEPAISVRALTQRKPQEHNGNDLTVFVLPEELVLQKAAIDYLRTRRKEIQERFAGDHVCRSVENPVSYFMAGSPGAGKTEYSKRLVARLTTDKSTGIARIDHDDIRDLFAGVGYNGTNAHVFQHPANLGVERVHDYALDHAKNFILDATMHNPDKARENIKRSLGLRRKVVIAYVYQDPLVAWDFTKKREALEGRHISKETFIRIFFEAKDAVNQVKQEFKTDVDLWLIEKNYTDISQERISLNIDQIDSYLKIGYSKEDLEKQLSP